MKHMLGLFLLLAGASPGIAETLLQTPTPEEIDAAIALLGSNRGSSGSAAGFEVDPQTDVRSIDGPALEEDYRFKGRRVWMQIETPFLRLARQVMSARASSLPVDRSLATEDVLAPELRIVAGPEPRRDDDVEIQEIVAERPDGSVIHCKVLERFEDRAQTRRRKGIKLRGLRATLPVEVLERGVKFRFKFKKHPDEMLAPAANWFDEAR